MKIRNQRGFTVVEGLIILIVVATIGFGGWWVFAKNDKTETRNTSANTSNSAAIATLPVDFTRVNIDKLGLSFAYPKVWGEFSEDTTYSNLYAGKFSKVGVDDSGAATNDSVFFYARTGKEDYTNVRRGGIASDYMGFKKQNGKYYIINKNVVDGKQMESVAKVDNPEIVKGFNRDVLLYSFEQYDVKEYIATFNLEGSYYACMISVNGTNKERMAELKKVASTVELL